RRGGHVAGDEARDPHRRDRMQIERQVDARVFGRSAHAEVAHDADDFDPLLLRYQLTTVRARAVFQAAPDRTAAAEDVPDERLVDDRDPRNIRIVGVDEQTARDW